MKHKTHYLYYLFYPRGLVSLRRSGCIMFSLLLLFSILTTAQEQTPPPGDFTVGSPIKSKLIDFPNLIIPFEAAGFNTIWQRAESYTQEPLEPYNLIALNEYNNAEYIFHYTTAYYSKWEAEQNQTNPLRVGVKHIGGQTASWYDPELNDTVVCWSTQGLSAPACPLMYGPHYRQDTRYKRWRYDWQNYKNVMYVPRFRMALDKSQGVSDSEDVCVIKAVFRYKIVYSENSWEYIDSVFMQRTLLVSDFDSTEKFDDFYLKEDPELAWYKYPEEFILPAKLENMANPPEYPYITYSESYTGIQFCVDWLRTDTRCTLYIDYAEVYDNNGWNEYINDPADVDSLIKSYAQSFSDWDNLIYWSGVDEPYSIDCYTPIHIVDSLIRSVQAPPLVVHFDPSWGDPPFINGEDEIKMFYNIAKPSKIILGMYPSSPNWSVIRKQDFDWLAFNFQRTSALESSFWFKPQAFGYRTNYPNDPQNGVFGVSQIHQNLHQW